MLDRERITLTIRDAEPRNPVPLHSGTSPAAQGDAERLRHSLRQYAAGVVSHQTDQRKNDRWD